MKAVRSPTAPTTIAPASRHADPRQAGGGIAPGPSPTGRGARGMIVATGGLRVFYGLIVIQAADARQGTPRASRLAGRCEERGMACRWAAGTAQQGKG